MADIDDNATVLDINWVPDPGFWNGGEAEQAVVDGFELLAYSLPATNGYPGIVGWEIFGDPDSMTQVCRGESATFAQAKKDAEQALGNFGSAGGAARMTIRAGTSARP
jgi:hypothetical protein